MESMTLNTTPNSVPIITPILIPDNTPEPVPNITTNSDPNSTPIEPKSPKKEGDNELNTENKKPTRTSDVWDHFTKIPNGNPLKPRCTCNYCGADYACHSKRVGTSSLWVHLDKCKRNPNRVIDKKQKVLSFQPGGDKTGSLLAVTFNKVRCRNALAKFVVKDEQAFNVVEGVGFREFVQELQPKFVVPGRNTITRDKFTRTDPTLQSVGKETHKRKLLENYLQQQQLFVTEKKNDLERYLAEEPISPMTPSFDILNWWKVNANRFKFLSMMAKDVLAIPVSTVASESAFSTSGRILDSFRSSLSPKMLEALVCCQSWLKEGYGGIKSKVHLDEAQLYKFIEEEDGTSHDQTINLGDE